MDNYKMKKLIAAVIVLIVFASWKMQQMVVMPGPLQESVNVVIPKGVGVRNVAELLAEKGVISQPLLFRVAARVIGLDKRLRAGEYEFAPHISMLVAMKKMAKGDVFYRRVTLPEGLTSKQMLEIINNERVLSGEITIDVKEGDLLPETYNYVLGDSKDSVVLQAKKAMEKIVEQAWKIRNAELPLKNPQEMLVLASIIEKETGVPEERGLVASVFVNRLRKGMKLQTDPTVIYALTKGQFELERQLLRKDLSIDSPYNTYVYFGLPPTPICNPGKDSILAAVQPSESDYLYFVASGNGGHNFSKNLNEHNRNVESYRRSN